MILYQYYIVLLDVLLFILYFYRTEVVDNNLSPTWREFEIEATRFNNGDRTRRMRFRVYDWDNDGS